VLEEFDREETKTVRTLFQDLEFHSLIMNWDLSNNEEYEFSRRVKHIFRRKGECLFAAG
jgi:hypothetical protein